MSKPKRYVFPLVHMNGGPMVVPMEDPSGYVDGASYDDLRRRFDTVQRENLELKAENTDFSQRNTELRAENGKLHGWKAEFNERVASLRDLIVRAMFDLEREKQEHAEAQNRLKTLQALYDQESSTASILCRDLKNASRALSKAGETATRWKLQTQEMQDRITRLETVVNIAVTHLEAIAEPLDCGCVPCTGACRTDGQREAEQSYIDAANEALREIRRAGSNG